MKKTILIINAVFVMNIANAQWVQTNLNIAYGWIGTLAISGDTIYAGSQNYGVYLSTNDGNSWTAVNTGLTTSMVNVLAINDTNIFAGTDKGVFLSTNNCNNWTAINTGLANIGYFGISTIAISGNNTFAGTYLNGIFLSNNNGGSWTSINSGLTNTKILSLTISGSNIFAGTSGGGVFISSNNGSSWTAVNTGLTGDALNVTALAIKGNNIFAATGTGIGKVYISSNNGGNWTDVSTGISQYSIIIPSLAVCGNIMFAGTWGNGSGMLMSTNDGQLWTDINTDLTDSVISLAINNYYIFAGTQQGKVWRRPLSDFGIYYNINEINNNADISIYPNPARDIFTIETNINTDQKIEILNLIGQCVYTNIINKKTTVNTSAFAKGVYIIKLYTDKETVVKKFVKE